MQNYDKKCRNFNYGELTLKDEVGLVPCQLLTGL